MSSILDARQRPARAIRIFTVTALVLTLMAMVSGLLFVHWTTGGTVFLFSVVAPVCVAAAVAIVLGIEILEFRRRHKLFLIERYPPEHTIFSQGDPGDSAYFIRSGLVEVVDESTGETLRTLGNGEYFGEIALITDGPRSATIRTVTDVEVAVLGKRNFLDMMRLIPATEEAILQTVQERATLEAGRGAERNH